MALNYFLGWNRKDLETELRAAQEDLAAGKALTQNRAGDVGSSAQIQQAPEVRIRMILQALNKLAPDDYPLDQITPTTSTRASFW